ncbi:hypothetical protein BN2537_2505 [Streptomyces venezuelae]|nr:hypothetical protein BN2537_2505 [Streptomyces venezuelae]
MQTYVMVDPSEGSIRPSARGRHAAAPNLAARARFQAPGRVDEAYLKNRQADR